jgi:RNA polymerase sigma-B factor
MNERQHAVERYLIDRSRSNRDALIAAHMHLCKRGARKFRRDGNDVADLEQVAAIGLVKATDTYCADRTTPFEAYAWIVIVGELMHYVRDHERPIRAPRWLRSIDRRYASAWESLAARGHAEPTPRQLASELDVALDVIGEVQAFRRGTVRDDDASGSRRIDALPARPAGLSIEERLNLLMAVDDLAERERIVVLGTFGAGLSQSEIAARLRLSQGQVSKILSRALQKLSRSVA